MVPIHDTDVAEERWSQSEWENYELWEKVELRLKRSKRLWVLATLIVFLALSAVPIVMDRWPKWKSRAMAVSLAQEINFVKKEASLGRGVYRLKLLAEPGARYQIDRVSSCSAAQGELVKAGDLAQASERDEYTWLLPSQGSDLGVPGLVHEFCYDSLSGSHSSLQGKSVVGFGIIPVRDLTEKRIDRLSLLLLSGLSAEISFD
jgi:hypothetical protein